MYVWASSAAVEHPEGFLMAFATPVVKCLLGPNVGGTQALMTGGGGDGNSSSVSGPEVAWALFMKEKVFTSLPGFVSSG